MSPSASACVAPLGAEVRCLKAAPHEAVLAGRFEPRQDAARRGAAGGWAWCGRAPGRFRTAAPRRRRSSAADAQRARRRVGVLEVGRVDDHAGHQARRERALGGVEGHAQARGQQRAHLARRGRARVDPVDGAEAGVGAVVVDVQDGHASEQLGVVREQRPDALQLAAVADHDEVVLEVGIRRLAEALDGGHEVVHRRHRDRRTPRCLGRPAPRRAERAQAQSRGRRLPGSRGRRRAPFAPLASEPRRRLARPRGPPRSAR